MRISAVFLAMSALSIGGCHGCERSEVPTPGSAGSASTPPAVAELTEAERKAAEDTIVAYYAAISVKDCVAMKGLAYKPLTQQDCDKIIEDYHEHGTKFVGITETKRDGRDPNAVIVKVNLLFKDKEHPTLARAVRVGDAWKVRY